MKRPNMKSSDIHRMQQLVTLFKKYTLNDPSNPNNRKTNQSIGDSDGTDWQNGVLVLVSNRLCLNKMQDEFYQPIRSFFQCSHNCGIIGGRPKEAFYLVGVQERNIILLDPHNTQRATGASEEDLKANHN